MTRSVYHATAKSFQSTFSLLALTLRAAGGDGAATCRAAALRTRLTASRSDGRDDQPPGWGTRVGSDVCSRPAYRGAPVTSFLLLTGAGVIGYVAVWMLNVNRLRRPP
jgi:hypothetical protein